MTAATPPETRRRIVGELKAIARDEVANSSRLKQLIRQDPRLGFHGEAFGYMYTPEKIDRKIHMVEELLASGLDKLDVSTLEKVVA